MKKLAGYALTLLLLAAVAALLLDSGSVQRIDSDVVSGERPVVTPRQTESRAVVKPASRLAVGARFTSLAELLSDQQAAGYLKVGSFGNSWPARVSEVSTDRDQIRFVRQNGTPHHYSKFNGYDMKMVRLKDGRKETIVVFRSQSRR